MEYKIEGIDTQFLHITLNANEAVVAEAGTMISMGGGIKLETIMGDGSTQNNSLLQKVFQAAKRELSGAGLFLTMFTNIEQTAENISFAAPYPGKVMAVELSEHQNTLICHSDAFLCATKDTVINIAFQKRMLAGIFGGSGFVLQKLEGNGTAFIHAGGTTIAHTLETGQILRVDPGCVVAFDQSVNFDIETVGGIKTAMFGGEGIFRAILTGPGKVLLQSMPFSRLVASISSRLVRN